MRFTRTANARRRWRRHPARSSQHARSLPAGLIARPRGWCLTYHTLFVQLGQVGVELGHHRRPFADGAPDAFHRNRKRTSPMAKTPGTARLQRSGDVSAARPDQFLEREVDPRLHETLSIRAQRRSPGATRSPDGAHERKTCRTFARSRVRCAGSSTGPSPAPPVRPLAR